METETLTLRAAVERLQRETSTGANAYEWYRKQASRSGSVLLGRRPVPAVKRAGVWTVTRTELDAALEDDRRTQVELTKVTRDYARGILRGEGEVVVRTEWGGYRIRGGFHLAWSYRDTRQRVSDGSWYCNTCMEPAATEHEKRECHTCRDWQSCRKDCTLSRVCCGTCGASWSLSGSDDSESQQGRP